MEKKKRNWLLWVLLIFLPPIGLIYMWVTKKEFSRNKKFIFTAIFGIWTLLLVLSSNNTAPTNEIADLKNESISNEYDSETENVALETERSEQAKVKEDAESNKYTSLSQLELDELQQFYLDFDSSMSYLEALEFVQNTGLPYSEEKYNGSRQIQVAFTDGCTVQKYRKESGPDISISYEYAKGENSINDDKSKYSFGTCVYTPYTGLSLIVHNTGYYFDISESGTYIKQLGNTVDELTNLSKEEQLLYYFNNQ